jgi:glutamate-1-semialdehyde 2,1-aminomutase
MEAARTEEPEPGYLEALRRLCHENGALFILDEMITGFRWHRKGAQERYGVTPDLSCFGKALGNGFAISALAGKREFMRLGGLEHFDKPRVFLLSTTHGAETHAMAAALATMNIYANEPVIEHLERLGRRLIVEGNDIAARHGLSGHFRIHGQPQCLVYAALNSNRAPCQGFRSLFLQETIRRGVLMPSLVVSYAHSDEDIDRTLEAIDGALRVYARALNDGYEAHLTGRPSQVVYRAFNTPPADRPASHHR